MPKHVIVVGAGAAGILAAWRAAALGCRVTLFEKTERVGTKILISGGGKCNITHEGSVDEVLRGFRADEARFLRPSMYRFNNEEVVRMLTDRALQVYTRPDGRIFPVDQTAKDVVRILFGYLVEVGVETRLLSPVTGLIVRGGRAEGVLAGPSEIPADAVIVCTGGSSYPNSGTTGDGWKWLREVGHKIVKLRAALAPIYLTDVEVDRSGVALRDCILKARQGGKQITKWRGDLLFTHHGISGPVALGISREVGEHLPVGDVQLAVDLVPNRSFEVLGAELEHYIECHPKRMANTFVESIAPERLARRIVCDAGIDPALPLSRIARRTRNRLVETIKGWRLGAVRSVPLERGEVVAGGVDLGEVDPHSMASRKVAGLYLCGEVLDVAGAVGGYNLQAAFSTGYVAGESSAVTS